MTTSASAKPFSTSPLLELACARRCWSACPASSSASGAVSRGAQVVVQDRRAVGHRLAHVEDRRQHLVLDLDQRRARPRRCAGRSRRRPRRRGRGRAPSSRPGSCRPRSAAAGPAPSPIVGDAVGGRREVGGGDDGLDAGQRQRLRGVDALDDGVGVRAALDAAVEHAGQADVGAVLGAAGDLVGAVGPDRAGADDLVLLLCDHVAS